MPSNAKVAGRKVLVVEDDDSMRQAIERLLNVASFTTAVYRSAEELLAAGPVEGDACVVSDLKLPGMSGLELLAALHARGWRRPMILITAHDSPAVRKDATQSGVAAYLAKPFLGTALVAAVKGAIEPAGSRLA
jgi:two-component system response regulator FixJ